jgi:hypothetical protein
MLPGATQWGKARHFGVLASENTAKLIAKRVGPKADGGAIAPAPQGRFDK